MKNLVLAISLLCVATFAQAQPLYVHGNLTVGEFAGGLLGYGNYVNFEGRDNNGDPMWIARNNTSYNQSELRVNIGDDAGQAEDKFVVGTHHWNGNVWVPHFAVQTNGNVGIGTLIPDAKLAVKGQVHAQEVKVDLSVPGPDYVFDSNYDLPSIEEVKAYIKQNHHLQEVPDAKEMEANGVNLGEMNMLLLKKVEELTLYVIELKTELNEVKKKVK